MPKINKTNAARLLDMQKISYELIPYEVDENNLGAEHIAEQLGEDLNQVFKTIVLQGDKNGYFVCVIPGCFHPPRKVLAHSLFSACPNLQVAEILEP